MPHRQLRQHLRSLLVDRPFQRFFRQEAAQLIDHQAPHPAAFHAYRPSDVRREHHVRQRPQGRIVLGRFRPGHVQQRPQVGPLGQHLRQVGLVDDRPARRNLLLPTGAEAADRGQQIGGRLGVRRSRRQRFEFGAQRFARRNPLRARQIVAMGVTIEEPVTRRSESLPDRFRAGSVRYR